MFEKTLREGAKTIFYEVGGGGVFNSMSSWKYAGVFQQQQQQQKQKTKVDVLKFKNMQDVFKTNIFASSKLLN